MASLSERSRRPVTEGAVIILSILAAFAIDTWWDARQERGRAAVQVESLKAEFAAVSTELARASVELNAALAATQQLARLAGPRPSAIPGDSIGRLITGALTINAVQLPTGALVNLLSSGNMSILKNVPLQTELASWPSISNLMSVKFGYLVANRDEAILPVMNRYIAISPLLSAAFGEFWTDEHHFEFDAVPLLSSREFESLMAERWINISIAAATVAQAEEVTSSINARLAKWR